MAELRTEAGLLLDVLIERLGALKTAAAAETPGGAADAESTADAETTADAGAAGPPAPGGSCPTCGHDPTRLSCSGCPVCALLAVLRGERPELTAKLIDGAVSAMTGMRALLGEPSDGQPSQSQSPSQPQPDRGADGSGEAPTPRAERIDIT